MKRLVIQNNAAVMTLLKETRANGLMAPGIIDLATEKLIPYIILAARSERCAQVFIRLLCILII